jgi:hypothetical protein
MGSLMLVTLGLVEVTDAWTAMIAWMHTHAFETYIPQLQVPQSQPHPTLNKTSDLSN